MDKSILARFFERKTSVEEEILVRKWLESDKNNKKILLEERLMYDALLLQPQQSTAKKKRTLQTRIWTISTVVAVFLLMLISSLYISNILGQRKTDNRYNTVIVPPGQRINLILPDNTNVWLNSNSRFRYPTQFAQNRTVFLNGEAYFDVTKNKRSPFMVKTDQGDIRVTGTTFNVEAYAASKTFETGLFEGSVDIYQNERKLVSLSPGEKSTLRGKKLVISKIGNTDKYLWRKGLIAFNNKNVEDIFLELEKYFDIKIIVRTKDLSQHSYTGKFRQSDGVDYALRVLQKSINFRYDRDEESQIIYIDN